MTNDTVGGYISNLFEKKHDLEISNAEDKSILKVPQKKYTYRLTVRWMDGKDSVMITTCDTPSSNLNCGSSMFTLYYDKKRVLIPIHRIIDVVMEEVEVQ